MPKIPIPLTDTKISKAKAKDKEYTLPDGNGLHLLIKPNGSKIWEFVYSSPSFKEQRKILIKDKNKKDILDKDGNKTYTIKEAPKRRKKAIGKYSKVGNTLKIEKMNDLELSNIHSATLAEARAIANRYTQIINNGYDCIEYLVNLKLKEEVQDNGLFENVMNEWFERQKSILENVTYKKKYQIFVSSVLPYFKDKHIKDITKLELLHVLEEKEKTAKETASRLFNYLSNLWGYAVLKDYCEHNFLANINKNDVLIEKRVAANYEKITDEETFKELVIKIYNYKGTVSIKNALRFVLHVPLRAHNLCNLKWEYIDFKEKILTIPRDIMKVKNPNLPPFKVPLTDEAINILKSQKEYSTLYTPLKEFVFMGTSNIKPINSESPNQALRRMGFAAEKKQTLHSFRGSYRTIAEERQEEHNISEKIMESVLDHHKELNKVELAYLNKTSYLEQQKPLMNWWSEYILSLKN
ncbi:tyrosine-type recombinase/integrase [Poseidonibacter ostreae]|uniref:tyrosine-type recombinase/integrase n=1 Tax=Poseidonibacter ostreae TaxID=2654171 RepID=UPI0012652F0A|nr:site-specific integrase [Poseidonibacter ostreae]KAB7886425.1 tyrosine-type recombinase/integrase [Poseidonibacter ostreae]